METKAERMKRKMAGAGSSCHGGETRFLSELRLVLLGRIWSGKSSAGNIILGGEHFDPEAKTMECVKSQSEVDGRQLTVVDAPGWWKNFSVQDTPELVKQEILHSVFLCTPGPHAFLLAIDVDSSFEEKHRRTVEVHLELLSKRVWRHTIVLFNYGDWTGDTTNKQLADIEGTALHWLVEKCGRRSHVLKRGDATQVSELLEKIEEMVAGNSGCHFEIESSVLQEVKERRVAEEERATQRLMKVQNEKETLRALLNGEARHLSELRIVMLGWAMVGKSSTANTILGTVKVDESRTAICVKRQGKVEGRRVIIVDTPGWWVCHSVQDTAQLVRQEILRSTSLCFPGPHVFLLVMDTGMSFTETHRRTIMEHAELFGKDVWRHALVVFTWAEWLGGSTIERHIESEGKALQWLIERCANRYHVIHNEDRGDGSQVTELLEKVEDMVALNSVFHLHGRGGSQEESTGLKETELKQQTEGESYANPEKLIAMFLEASKRMEQDMLENIRRMLVDVDPKEGASLGPPPNFGGETLSEVSSCELVRSHDKVSGWLRDSSASGYGTNSVSSSECPEITEETRDQ
ncbi:hypothetical protein AAFF_G00358220 [Aldrovandia affinis]|uniref:AIG1-type G domain-containing protein n=1 Tax=Aldrovandia affinis TaxID=143900 RepID=A0AAD7X214_9TELE|nr:hypothetical protein AAFF_G00358220 [Aldrovandia affinis]